MNLIAVAKLYPADAKLMWIGIVQVTVATLAAKLTDSNSSAADKKAALKIIGNMSLPELAPQENALQLVALNDTDDDVKKEALATLEKLKAANDAKPLKDVTAAEKAADLIKAGDEKATAEVASRRLEWEKDSQAAAKEVPTRPRPLPTPRLSRTNRNDV